MTLRDYLLVARRWWWLVVVGCALAGAAAWLVTSRMTPTYEARAVLLVNQGENPGAPTYNDILGSQSLTRTYGALVTSDLNLQRVADRIGLPVEVLEERVEARPVPETQLIEVIASDSDPERAAFIANLVAEVFPGYIAEAQGSDAAANRVVVADRAAVPDSPASPNTALNIALGVVLGLLVMGAAVALVEYLDDGIDERADIEALGASYLGSVLQATPPKGADRNAWLPTILAGDPRGPLAESYRQVQANLAFAMGAAEAKVILVTSPHQGEGKSTTAANLALALAESSKLVLLIDGDLRKPDAHRYFSLPNNSGLTSTFLVDPQSSQAFVDRVGESLSVLTAGPLAPNPTELLGSRKMQTIVETLRASYDVVIVDSPPILGLADARLWLPLVDGVLLVARRGKTRRGALEEAIAAIRASRTPLLGVVLNGMSRRRAAAYGYTYGYDYGAANPES